MSVLKAIYYLLGIIFYIIIIIGIFLILYKVWYTAATIKRTLLGPQIEELICQLKEGFSPSLRNMGLIP